MFEFFPWVKLALAQLGHGELLFPQFGVLMIRNRNSLQIVPTHLVCVFHNAVWHKRVYLGALLWPLSWWLCVEPPWSQLGSIFRAPSLSCLVLARLPFDLCWSWNSNTLATWCKELTHWKRPWCWERLRWEEKGMTENEIGWMASPTQCTWIWVNSGSWWWTGRPGVLQNMGLQRVGHDWVTERLNWTELLTYADSVHCPAVVLCGYIKPEEPRLESFIVFPLCESLQQLSVAPPSLLSLWNPTLSSTLPCSLHLPATSLVFPLSHLCLVLTYQAAAGVNIFKLGN